MLNLSQKLTEGPILAHCQFPLILSTEPAYRVIVPTHCAYNMIDYIFTSPSGDISRVRSTVIQSLRQPQNLSRISGERQGEVSCVIIKDDGSSR